jgi:hypothetical protein
VAVRLIQTCVGADVSPISWTRRPLSLPFAVPLEHSHSRRPIDLAPPGWRNLSRDIGFPALRTVLGQNAWSPKCWLTALQFELRELSGIGSPPLRPMNLQEHHRSLLTRAGGSGLPVSMFYVVSERTMTAQTQSCKRLGDPGFEGVEGRGLFQPSPEHRPAHRPAGCCPMGPKGLSSFRWKISPKQATFAATSQGGKPSSLAA